MCCVCTKTLIFDLAAKVHFARATCVSRIITVIFHDTVFDIGWITAEKGNVVLVGWLFWIERPNKNSISSISGRLPD